MATPADVRPDSRSRVSKVLRGSSARTDQHVTESPAMLPNTGRTSENKGPASSASEPITVRQGLFPSTPSQPHPAEQLPVADKRPIKIGQKPLKKPPTKTTKPSTNGKQPGGKPNKPRQQAEKVKQPSKVVQTPDGTRQEPIKHGQQTSRGSKQPIKTGQKPLYRKQKQQNNKGPIKTAQRLSSTTDWPFTTGRPQDGHSLKTPSSPFSITQYSPPTARLRPTATHTPTARLRPTATHTRKTGADTPVHTHTPQMLSTPSPAQTQEDPKHTTKTTTTTITTTTAKQISQQHDNTPPLPLHTLRTTQSSTTLTTQRPAQASPNATPHTHIQGGAPVTPSSSRVTGPHRAPAKRPHSPLAAAPSQQGHPAPSPSLVTETPANQRGRGDKRPGMRLPGPRPSVTTLLRTRRPFPGPVANRPRGRNSTFSPRKTDVAVEGMQGVTLTKPAPRARNGSSVLKHRPRPLKHGLNQVVKAKQEDKATRFDSGENASIFSPDPTSKVDAMGKERFTAPHVIYQTDKRPEEPCSITQTLGHFPEDEPSEVNVTAPPRLPPTNLTVVAVEGCPSFIILDWDKADNETTEYEVTSSTKGPQGKEVSVLVTNKTHTAVENLKPESRYEFTVTPKNELGVGPSTDPVTFSTESADPRVAEVTGKRAIWSTFPFKLEMNSECNGPQYIKRTWYRKFVGIQLCNSLRYKIYLSDSLRGPFYHIGDQSGYGEDHCQFVDSLLDGRTGSSLPFNKLPETEGFYRAMRQEPVEFGTMGGNSHINYVSWYECGVAIPGKW
ncbi:target of Nesh-SH3 isoform X3 [Sardina pilchardus]|uniref:target of Nesh-SH3 isoform X3 n=1 Tax=Sardina pilchardus TaxID=27697 RepID=UPI002E0E1326